MAAFPKESEFELSFTISTQAPFKFDSPLEIKISIRPPPSFSMANTVVRYSGKFYQATSEKVSGNSAVLKLRPFAKQTFADIPYPLVFTLEKDTQRLAPLPCAIRSEDFVKHILDHETELNLLLFGAAGTGKSSFINSIFTLLSPIVHTQLAPSGGSTERVTVEFRRYRLASIDLVGGRPKILRPTGIRIWDTWGLERNKNYTIDSFTEIAEGNVPHGTSMFDMSIDPATASAVAAPIDPTRFHAVLFFIPIECFKSLDEIGAEAKMTQPFVHQATILKLPAFIILTMADVVWSSFRDDPSSVPPETKAYVTNAATFFRVPEVQVVISLNYHKETTKSFALDRLLAQTLTQAIVAASGPAVRFDLDDYLNS